MHTLQALCTPLLESGEVTSMKKWARSRAALEVALATSDRVSVASAGEGDVDRSGVSPTSSASCKLNSSPLETMPSWLVAA
jgi:hypothetical protein